MNIGVNARLLLHNKLEGIGWYAHQILSRIVKAHPEHHFFFFFDRPYHEEFIYGSNVTPVVLGPQARHPLLFHIWFDWRIAPAIKKYKIDIFFSPESFTTTRSGVPQIITIHDLAYIHYPKQIARKHLMYYRKFQPVFASKAKAIIAVSQYTKEDIMKQYGISGGKISVVYNAANSTYKPLPLEERLDIKEKYTDGREYFLFVGALHPRKNIINLLKAFVQFKRRQQCALKLVIVGRMAWQTNEIEEAKNRMPYKEDVVWLGYTGVEELSKITAAAYAMVYPSLFEGFGIPIIEAMACGVPAIVSNVSSMPEVAGSAALLADPNDPKDIAEKMGLMYKDESLRSNLSDNCFEEIRRFDWDQSAGEVWKLLYDLSKKENNKKEIMQ